MQPSPAQQFVAVPRYKLQALGTNSSRVSVRETLLGFLAVQIQTRPRTQRLLLIPKSAIRRDIQRWPERLGWPASSAAAVRFGRAQWVQKVLGTVHSPRPAGSCLLSTLLHLADRHPSTSQQGKDKIKMIKMLLNSVNKIKRMKIMYNHNLDVFDSSCCVAPLVRP